jgi:hypothetical protein
MDIIAEMKQWNTKDWIKSLLYIALTIALGYYALMKFIDFRYAVYLLKNPCDICLDLNPQIDLVTRINMSLLYNYSL